jgi:Flp pilus assembly protein TadG
MGSTPRSHARGQALAEFALTLPVFLLLLFGLIDGGRLVIEYSTLANASRAGARVAIVNQSNSVTCGTVRTFKCAVAAHSGEMGIKPADVVDVTTPDCATGDCTVTVTVTHSYDLITPIIASILGPVELEAQTTMPVERLYSNP